MFDRDDERPRYHPDNLHKYRSLHYGITVFSACVASDSETVIRFNLCTRSQRHVLSETGRLFLLRFLLRPYLSFCYAVMLLATKVLLRRTIRLLLAFVNRFFSFKSVKGFIPDGFLFDRQRCDMATKRSVQPFFK